MHHRLWTTVGAGALAAAAALGLPAAGMAQQAATPADSQTAQSGSCDSFLPQQTEMDGKKIGASACRITGESSVTDSKGGQFVRVDVAIDGTAAGYVTPATKGATRKDLTEVPEILYPQFGITHWVKATADYSGGNGDGTGLTLLYPDPKAGTPWNGKVFLLTHGQSDNTPIGDVITVPKGQPFVEQTFSNLYAGLMIEKGYAVIYTRRPGRGGVEATLEDGSTLEESLNDNIGLILDYLHVGNAMLTDRLGKAPTASYFYGHSAGVILGRLMNYTDRNIGPDGKRYFDGFLFDDAGGGLPLPLKLDEGDVLGQAGDLATYNPKDMLFQDDAAKKDFTKEINFSHALYTSTHDWLPDVTYLTLKRQDALILHQEGMDTMTRAYELDGVSHIANTTKSPEKTLDIGPVIDAGIDLLDDWVQNDVPPPPSVMNLAALGDGSVYAQAQHETIDLPPVACPTGLRFAYGPPPAGGATQTGYAAYDGSTPEPVDSRGFLVDVNGDGWRDAMPTAEAEWQALGLLAPGAKLDHDAYVACVHKATDRLMAQGLLTQPVADWYLQKADAYPNVAW